MVKLDRHAARKLFALLFLVIGTIGVYVAFIEVRNHPTELDTNYERIAVVVDKLSSGQACGKCATYYCCVSVTDTKTRIGEQVVMWYPSRPTSATVTAYLEQPRVPRDMIDLIAIPLYTYLMSVAICVFEWCHMDTESMEPIRPKQARLMAVLFFVMGIISTILVIADNTLKPLVHDSSYIRIPVHIDKVDDGRACGNFRDYYYCVRSYNMTLHVDDRVMLWATRYPNTATVDAFFDAPRTHRDLSMLIVMAVFAYCVALALWIISRRTMNDENEVECITKEVGDVPIELVIQ